MAPRRHPLKRALLIGICYRNSKAPGFNALNAPHRDIAEMKNILIKYFGYLEANITILMDDISPDKPDPSRRLPTRKNILHAIRALRKRVKAGDKLFFYYTGHGAQLISRNGTEEDDLDEVIVPFDHNGVPVDRGFSPLDPRGLPADDPTAKAKVKGVIRDNTLHKLLVNGLPEGVTLTAIFDACHSGTILDLKHYTCNNVWFPWCVDHYGFAKPTLCLRKRCDARMPSRIVKNYIHKPISWAITRDIVDPPTHIPNSIIPTLLDDSRSKPTRASYGSWILPEDYEELSLRRCDSPERAGGLSCDGIVNCREKTTLKPHKGGDVICLSFSLDTQCTWETNKLETMTSLMLEILEERHGRICLDDLVLLIGHAMYQKCMKLQQAWTSSQKRSMTNQGLYGCPVPYQTPQLGSMRPLDVKQRFLP